MTLTEQTEMDAFLEEGLATGRIRQSKSPLGFRSPPLLGPEWHQTNRRHIGKGPCNTTAPSAITWTLIYGRLGTRRLGTIILYISFVDCSRDS
jgi:hypothetical protein